MDVRQIETSTDVGRDRTFSMVRMNIERCKWSRLRLSSTLILCNGTEAFAAIQRLLGCTIRKRDVLRWKLDQDPDEYPLCRPERVYETVRVSSVVGPLLAAQSLALVSKTDERQSLHSDVPTEYEQWTPDYTWWSWLSSCITQRKIHQQLVYWYKQRFF